MAADATHTLRHAAGQPASLHLSGVTLVGTLPVLSSSAYTNQLQYCSGYLAHLHTVSLLDHLALNTQNGS